MECTDTFPDVGTAGRQEADEGQPLVERQLCRGGQVLTVDRTQCPEILAADLHEDHPATVDGTQPERHVAAGLGPEVHRR